MYDHEFERQVHQKMEGLQLEPSDAVWEQVEGRLHKKRRRRIIFWLPLLLAALVAGGYILLHNTHLDKAPLLTRSTSSSGDKRKGEMEETKTTAHTPKRNPSARAGSLQPTGGLLAGGKNNRPAAVILNNTSHRHVTYTSSGDYKRIGKNNRYTGIPEKQQVLATNSLTGEEKSFPTKTSLTQTDSLPSNELVAALPPPVSLHEPFHTLFTGPAEEKAVQTVHLSNTKRLHWGIGLSLIRTSINDGSLGKLFSYQSMADLAYANLNVVSTPNNGNIAVAKPSVVQAGTGFSAGFFLKKEIGSRWAFSTGLNYTLYRTSVRIGQTRDSAMAQFNTSNLSRYFLTVNSSYSRSYTNNYHFIGLPLLLQFQLNRGKLPIVWEGGTEIAWLAGSNALHYSSTLRGYYKNNRLLNHTQFYILTGLQIQAFSHTRYPINVGPQMQVGLSNLTTSVSKREHLTQYGLKISTQIK